MQRATAPYPGGAPESSAPAVPASPALPEVPPATSTQAPVRPAPPADPPPATPAASPDLGPQSPRCSPSPRADSHCNVDFTPVVDEGFFEPADEGPSFWDTMGPLWLPLVLPTVCYLPAQLLHVYIIGVYARHELGCDDAIVGMVAASRMLGNMIGNVFAGPIHHTYGAAGMYLGTTVTAVGAFGTALPRAGVEGQRDNRAVGLLILAQLLFGVGQAWWVVSRTSYVKARVPQQHRGRVTGLLAGLFRVMTCIGPVGAGYLAHHVGYRWVFYIQGGFSLLTSILGFALLQCGPAEHIKASAPTGYATRSKDSEPGMCATLTKHRRLLLLGSATVFIISVLRAVRDVAIQLRGDDLGLTNDQIGWIASAGGLPDTVIGVTLAGYVMDTWGRKWAGGPAMTLLSVALGLVALCNSVPALIGISVVLGVGNGISGPLVQVLGQDLAPSGGHEAMFLAMVFSSANLGGTLGPILYGSIQEGFGLQAAAVSVGGLCLLFVLVYCLCMPETVGRRGPQGKDVCTVSPSDCAPGKAVDLNDGVDVDTCSDTSEGMRLFQALVLSGEYSSRETVLASGCSPECEIAVACSSARDEQQHLVVKSLR
eukprot:TRINITY_DN32647_c0_g1_i1.p1 TRINITY_DN32647_c0_g1~~TRINITY_DN32647_c0_g1_i1.p1  ORF type:complete len:618 (+),score=103.85 TRINITY_DN32647_c0_g1_i1:64-1854(+)